MSKNALKKQKKLEEAQRKKEEKAAAAKAKAAENPSTKKKNAEDEEELDPSKYLENRLNRLDAELSRQDQYPHKFQVTKSLKEFIRAYRDIEEDSGELPEERVTGRLMMKRSSGGKLYFYDLVQDGVKVQVLSQPQ